MATVSEFAFKTMNSALKMMSFLIYNHEFRKVLDRLESGEFGSITAYV